MSVDTSGLEAIYEALSKKRQRYALLEINRYFRRSLGRRLRQQTDVKGKSFTPRVKRNEKRKMLLGFAKPNRLKTQITESGFMLGYTGKQADRARIHNLGLMDRVRNKFKQIQTVRYPAREWVGISEDDITQVHLILARHLGV